MHPSALRTVHSALVVLLPSQVAAELEEAQELEGRNRSVQLLQLQQKVSSLELERMQSQLTCMRVEDQLNESRIQRTELAKRLAVAEASFWGGVWIVFFWIFGIKSPTCGKSGGCTISEETENMMFFFLLLF